MGIPNCVSGICHHNSATDVYRGMHPTIIHGTRIFLYVCSAIKLAPSRKSARDALCQLMDSGVMFLAGCRSPSCLAAEEGDVLRQFSAGRYALFDIIDQPFLYRSLAYLIRAMLV